MKCTAPIAEPALPPVVVALPSDVRLCEILCKKHHPRIVRLARHSTHGPDIVAGGRGPRKAGIAPFSQLVVSRGLVWSGWNIRGLLYSEVGANGPVGCRLDGSRTRGTTRLTSNTQLQAIHAYHPLSPRCLDHILARLRKKPESCTYQRLTSRAS